MKKRRILFEAFALNLGGCLAEFVSRRVKKRKAANGSVGSGLVLEPRLERL